MANLPILEMPLPFIKIVNRDGGISVEFNDWLIRLTTVLNQIIDKINILADPIVAEIPPLPPMRIIDDEAAISVEFNDWLIRLTTFLNQIIDKINTL